jgi:Neisseria PilC beta-propeller domain
VSSLLPAIANWLSPAIRGLLAMAPPPPPVAPAGAPCVGIPAGLTTHPIQCVPCGYDPTRLCGAVDIDGDGLPDLFVDNSRNGSSLVPVGDRGFDDPQADPDPTLTLRKSIQIQYRRADLFDLGGGLGTYAADDSLTGNPPWGSQPAQPDNDADSVIDTTTIPDRHNQGSYASIFDADAPRQRDQQFPNDAFGEISCPFPPLSVPCDVYSQDCGGFAKNFDSAPSNFDPYPVTAPPLANTTWPVVPFPRDWIATDTDSKPAIKRLLRFASSVVSYDSTQTHMNEYRLEETARDVVVTAPGTPLAGALKDAYDYFVNAVFTLTDDPSINCRNYIIVFLTDGLEECFGNPCSGGTTGKGPAGDLGAVLLPENPPGARATAHAADSSVPVDAVPVFVVGLGLDPNDPRLTCIADNSSSTTDPTRKGKVFGVTNRTDLQNALQSILNFKNTANSFAAPAVPAFASGTGTDTAQIGAVIPSHRNNDGTLSQWAIWSGSLKSYRLDPVNGTLPIVTAAASGSTPTAVPTGSCSVGPGTPTPTPSVGSTATGFPDESDPDNSSEANRKPVWNAARVLGYTDPVANLGEAQAAGPAVPASKAPAISVWPGRKMVWASGTGVPLARQDFLCPSGTCANGLITAFGLNPLLPADQTKSKLTVDFLRGGVTSNGVRDEVLNQPAIFPAGNIGPGAGQQQKYSYFYQDDCPAPGCTNDTTLFPAGPQLRTDDAASPKGYAHKLGDIFHSEPLVLDPPRYFQYISANTNNYNVFSTANQFRRRVLFVGANDGFLHAIDAGLYNRDTTNFPNAFDLGTGREIFAYSPSAIMNKSFPNMLTIPPPPAQYFVDGGVSKGDVFIDPRNNGTPTPADRIWRTVIVGGLRQGGALYFALDVTQPDKLDATGNKIAAKDTSPDCLNGGGGAGCSAGKVAARNYPEVLWELTDASLPIMGETWSRPVIGRIKVLDAGNPKDKFVAIFGGGFDPTWKTGDPILLADQSCPPTCPARKATRGRAIYIVDIETGEVLSKLTHGSDTSGGSPVQSDFAPMPAAPAAADYDDDGYLDIAYIGDANGRMWRVDLTPDGTAGRGVCNNCDTAAQTVSGYDPFLLFDASTADGTAPSSQPKEPIFQEPAIIFVNGGIRPTLGIAWGTGDRSDLTASATAADLAAGRASIQRAYYVIDSNQTTTFHESDLHDVTPGAPLDTATGGFRLDFETLNEKTTSSVLSTQGYLTLITFTPDSTNPCTNNGNSFRYRFFFVNGKGGYNIVCPTNSYADYRADMGAGVASESQTTQPNGTTINMFVRSDTSIPPPEILPGDLSTTNQNWKEQQ